MNFLRLNSLLNNDVNHGANILFIFPPYLKVALHQAAISPLQLSLIVVSRCE